MPARMRSSSMSPGSGASSALPAWRSAHCVGSAIRWDRSMKSKSSLFWRLTALISAILLGGAAILAIAASYYARTAADDAYDRVLLGAARQISETLSAESGTVEAD